MIKLLTQPQLHLANILNSYDWYQKVQNRNLSHLCSNFRWEFFRFFCITCSQSVCSWMLEIKFVLPKRLMKTHSTSSTNQTELWADGLCMYVSVLERFHLSKKSQFGSFQETQLTWADRSNFFFETGRFYRFLLLLIFHFWTSNLLWSRPRSSYKQYIGIWLVFTIANLIIWMPPVREHSETTLIRWGRWVVLEKLTVCRFCISNTV